MNKKHFSYNAQYMTVDGNAWFPIMGEIHYSRYPRTYWKEAILKMQAGGVDLISSYVFWIHHEEIEGEYDFTGQRDLRAFLQVVKECQARLILRIGPWCHGEVRNGGFPDWLLYKPFEARSNDEQYFAQVEKFYQKIYEQVEGFLYKDGGPIIGVQIENEYGHCGGLQGEKGENHMKRLKDIAVSCGFDVPYYTATGWGGAVTGGMLPVMGGYCEAPWDQRLTDIEPSGNYVFTKERNDHNIGSDHGFGEGITFDMEKFPFLTAELGGGLQVTDHRRPVARATDIGAMSLVKIGCGVNLLGYYMYHGGTNPIGKRTTLQESRATGYPNDVPEFSYDFAAPIREYGQVSDTYREIKKLAMFTRDFGEELCKMKVDLPADNPLNQNNLVDVRYSVRRNGDTGYVFINNYQRRYPMAEHMDYTISVETQTEKIVFPSMTIKDKDYYFYPFNMPIGNAVLKMALATPLCFLQTGDGQAKTYVFYTDGEPQYCIQGELGQNKLLTISNKQAANAWKITKNGADYLLISDGVILNQNAGSDREKRIVDCGDMTLLAYPALPEIPEEFEQVDKQGEFACYKRKARTSAQAAYKVIKEEEGSKTYEVTIAYQGTPEDCFLHVDFAGDKAKLYVDDVQVSDWFYTGDKWEIGLKRFHLPSKITIEITPLAADARKFLEKWPEMINGSACRIDGIECKTEESSKLC